MTLALLHRRLTVAMALAALVAFGAGEGATTPILLTGAGLALALFWRASATSTEWVERATRAGIVALCAWMLYVAFVLVADFMPAVMAMLLFLLVAETLRALNARNDMRLYALSFALLIAATAYYSGLLFAGAFVAYIVLATLALMVGFLRRQAEAHGVARLPLGRPFLAATASLSIVVVAISAFLFVLFPRLPRQWNVQGRAGNGPVMAGFSDQVSIGEHGTRISNNSSVILRVEFPGGPPPPQSEMYWRARSFDRFDGVRWSRTAAGRMLLAPGPRWYAERWGGPFRQQRIYGGPAEANVLFGLAPVLDVRGRSALRIFREPTGDLVYFGTDEPVYTVTSAAPAPPPQLLEVPPGEAYPPDFPYLQLPRLTPRVARLADSLAATQRTRLGRALAVRDYLRNEFGYTLELPRTARDATLDAFLFRRREGHCEYFATAMAVLLRRAGIPTREVNGFLGGTWKEREKYLAVTGNDAHAWVEVWFPEAGWVTFDPTPLGRRNRAVERARPDSWGYQAYLWFDGVQYRWYKWVIGYDLDKQVGLFRRVGEMFSRPRGGAGSGSGRAAAPRLREVAPWLLAAVALLFVWRFGRRGAAASIAPPARHYLRLRRAYRRAGFDRDETAPPLRFAEALQARAAPGADAAARAVELYLRARFGPGGATVEELGDMTRCVDAALAALHAARRIARPEPAGAAADR